MPDNKKQVEVPFVENVCAVEKDEISTVLDSLTKHGISEICWNSLNNKPDVSFAICYNRQAIFLKFYVIENTHRAIYTVPNDPVYKDSCVEFFFAIDDSGAYYNFEFNSLGTILASHGKDRIGRTMFKEDVIRKIKCGATWKDYQPARSFYKWEITVVLIPSVFHFNHIDAFYPASYKGNFYKCGDDLPEPHYLSWSPITSPAPNFHQPAYFGLLNFIQP